MSEEVTVAIPVRDGGVLLKRTIAALARQTVAHELLLCDSGSRDGAAEDARAHGARVIEIAPEDFGHGATRNLLMQQARGRHVALLTQDAEPADERWLERLLGAFALAPRVGLAFGPYIPRPDASVPVRLELERWFHSLAPDGAPRVDRLSEAERRRLTGGQGRSPYDLVGARGFFTDANACISRAAWERVPFRDAAYAEDRLLAADMLHAGFAKVYVPDAAVRHSHSYSSLQELQRCFDEWRALREVYGHGESIEPTAIARRLRGELGSARRELERQGLSPAQRRTALVAVARHQLVRQTGALLGSNAARLPPRARRALSLEGRDSFQPFDFAAPPGQHSIEPDQHSMNDLRQ